MSVFAFRVEPRRPDSKMAYAEMPGLTFRERQEVALLHALGLWTAPAIAEVYGVTKDAVFRARNHFHVVPR